MPCKHCTDVKLVLLYRLILGTYIIFVRKNNFLSPSVYCPDTSKRVPQIVTATEAEWRNQFVRTETKHAKNHDTLRDLKKRSEILERQVSPRSVCSVNIQRASAVATSSTSSTRASCKIWGVGWSRMRIKIQRSDYSISRILLLGPRGDSRPCQILQTPLGTWGACWNCMHVMAHGARLCFLRECTNKRKSDFSKASILMLLFRFVNTTEGVTAWELASLSGCHCVCALMFFLDSDSTASSNWSDWRRQFWEPIVRIHICISAAPLCLNDFQSSLCPRHQAEHEGLPVSCVRSGWSNGWQHDINSSQSWKPIPCVVWRKASSSTARGHLDITRCLSLCGSKMILIRLIMFSSHLQTRPGLTYPEASAPSQPGKKHL